MKGKWTNCVSDGGMMMMNPLREYFNEEKFDVWLNMCDIAQDVDTRIKEMVHDGYLVEFNRRALEKLISHFTYDLLTTQTDLSKNLQHRQILNNLIVKSLLKDSSSQEFFTNLRDHLIDHCNEGKKKMIETPAKEEVTVAETAESAETAAADETVNKTEGGEASASNEEEEQIYVSPHGDLSLEMLLVHVNIFFNK